MPLAHPLTQPYNLPVSPVIAACAAAALVLLVALAWPEPRTKATRRRQSPVGSWEGSLSPAQWATRLAAVALVIAAIVAGRLGADDELENLASALVVGAGWPLLVLASVLFGPVWRWLDPWDGIARVAAADGRRPDHVWPALFPALVWVWYLSAYARPLDPRSIGTLLAAYTVVTIAGCLALGRQTWLSSAEPLGIVLSWLALLPRRRLVDWEPPRGAEALLGVLAGGILFGAARRSELWGGLNTAEHSGLLAALGVLAAAVAAAALLVAIARQTPRLAARAAVPAVAGIVVAVAMDRNRLSTSIQLLPGLLGDPLGRGWDLLGRAGSGLDPAPLGERGLLVAQLGALLAGQLAGAVVVATSTGRANRGPAAVGLSILAAAAVIAVVSH